MLCDEIYIYIYIYILKEECNGKMRKGKSEKRKMWNNGAKLN
jgi:hypothetical protein